MIPAIFAPAGNRESLQAALNARADGVYFGVGSLNMRAGGAMNFTLDDLPETVRKCHATSAGAYLALNTIVYDSELAQVRALCEAAKDSGVDAVIAGDPAVLSILRELRIPAHITVQCNVSNLEAVKFYSSFADVIVLARELPLGSIAEIIRGIRRRDIRGPSGELVKIEIFAHGALCVGISGLCSMSLCSYGKSAARGRCLQNCRRRYTVRDAETGAELELDNPFVMSPKDIRTVGFLDRILDTGVSVLKIEGRGRPADYVAATVEVYREARDACLDGTFSQEKVARWNARLETVFHRGFWDGGYYLGNTLSAWSAAPGSIATYRKVYVGRIGNYYSKAGAASMTVEAGELRTGDRLLVTGGATGALELTLTELRVEDNTVPSAGKGALVSFPVPGKVRPGDRVQILKERIAEEED